MSEFGEDLEVRRESDPKLQNKLVAVRQSLGGNDSLLEGETELLDRLRSPQPQSPAEDEEDDPGQLFGDGGEDDFQLFLLDENQIAEAAALQRAGADEIVQPAVRIADEAEPATGSINDQHTVTSPQPKRRLTILETSALATQTIRRKKRQKMTRHGSMVPSLPTSLIKRIATESCVRNGRRRPQLGKDHMAALEQASEWFFEQIGEDLAAYAEHGKRTKRVDASDVLVLMRRQLVDLEDVKKLAEEVLPEDVAAELDLEDDDA